MKKVLFVLTSHGEKGNAGSTGYHLGEVSHPWKVLHDAGVEMDFTSPKGGEPPVDGFDLEDPTNKEFWNHPVYKEKRIHTQTPKEINPNDYSAIYFAGGHGTMWDFPDNTELQELTKTIYESGGIVGAVCHGPSALVNVKLSNGTKLIAGKRVNGFSNEEEEIVKLEGVVPFLLENQLIGAGGKYSKSAPWNTHVEVDERLVTGQNPQSAKAVGEAILKLLKK